MTAKKDHCHLWRGLKTRNLHGKQRTQQKHAGMDQHFLCSCDRPAVFLQLPYDKMRILFTWGLRHDSGVHSTVGRVQRKRKDFLRWLRARGWLMGADICMSEKAAEEDQNCAADKRRITEIKGMPWYSFAERKTRRLGRVQSAKLKERRK